MNTFSSRANGMEEGKVGNRCTIIILESNITNYYIKLFKIIPTWRYSISMNRFTELVTAVYKLWLY